MSVNQTQLPPPIQPPPPIARPPPDPESQSRTWKMVCHLSVLAGYVIPFGNFVGPFLIWQSKKHEIPSVKIHGKAAPNFQITVFIALVAGTAVAVILSFFCIGLLFIPVLAAVAIYNVIFPIIAAIKANDGEDFKYPGAIEFLK